MGVPVDTYKNLRKNELEALVEKNEGGGNGGGGGGGGTVTAAAAAAGVKSRSPQSAAAAAASPKKAKNFLKKAVAKFGTVKSHANLAVGGKKGVIRISPPRGNKTRKATKMDIEKSPEFAASTPWKPKPLFESRKVSPVSPTEQEITYKNGFKCPVMIKQSILPPSFVPRRAAISKIPGHNYPLDPGASIKFKVTKGNTLYVHDGGGKLMESLSTKAHAKYGPETETRYVPTAVGNVKSNFTKGAITKIKKSQSGGRRRRTRRRSRTRRRRRRRRTRR